MCPSDWVFLVLPVPEKLLFFAFLGFFSGIILDRSNGFFRFPPTTLELKLYPKSSVRSAFSFVGWPSLKCTLHTRVEFFGVQTFPFLISLLIFSDHRLLPSLSFFSVGKGKSLNGGSQSQVCVPFKHAWTVQVCFAHLFNLFPLFGQPTTTLFRCPNPIPRQEIKTEWLQTWNISQVNIPLETLIKFFIAFFFAEDRSSQKIDWLTSL